LERKGKVEEMEKSSLEYINRLYKDEREIKYKIAIAQINYLMWRGNHKSFLWKTVYKCTTLQVVLWKILKEMGMSDHLTCFLRKLYAGQEATVRTRNGTMDWFKIGKRIYFKTVHCHPDYLKYM